jgi:iron transport multicopper oxidase
VLTFGGHRVGQPATETIIFRNAGSDPLTIDGVEPPAAPFSLSGAPGPGTELQSGEEVTITVTFAPAAIGDYADALTLESDGGDVEVGLAGSARTPPRLELGGSGAFGDVQLGSSAERTVTLTNTGGLRLTVLKSKPPIGGPFSAVTSLPEGTSIPPGASASLTVRFTPAAAGAAQSAWTITADDGSGIHEIAFAGAGVGQGINETPLQPIIPTVTPTLTPKVVRPKLSSLRAKVKRTRLSLSFRLDRAAKVRIEVKRGTRVAKRVTVSARKGTNRKTIALRPGRYIVSVAAIGGNAGSRSVRVT